MAKKQGDDSKTNTGHSLAKMRWLAALGMFCYACAMQSVAWGILCFIFLAYQYEEIRKVPWVDLGIWCNLFKCVVSFAIFLLPIILGTYKNFTGPFPICCYFIYMAMYSINFYLQARCAEFDDRNPNTASVDGIKKEYVKDYTLGELIDNTKHSLEGLNGATVLWVLFTIVLLFAAQYSNYVWIVTALKSQHVNALIIRFILALFWFFDVIATSALFCMITKGSMVMAKKEIADIFTGKKDPLKKMSVIKSVIKKTLTLLSAFLLNPGAACIIMVVEVFRSSVTSAGMLTNANRGISQAEKLAGYNDMDANEEGDKDKGGEKSKSGDIAKALLVGGYFFCSGITFASVLGLAFLWVVAEILMSQDSSSTSWSKTKRMMPQNGQIVLVLLKTILPLYMFYCFLHHISILKFSSFTCFYSSAWMFAAVLGSGIWFAREHRKNVDNGGGNPVVDVFKGKANWEKAFFIVLTMIAFGQGCEAIMFINNLGGLYPCYKMFFAAISPFWVIMNCVLGVCVNQRFAVGFLMLHGGEVGLNSVVPGKDSEEKERNGGNGGKPVRLVELPGNAAYSPQEGEGTWPSALCNKESHFQMK
jgi:hypothetical protein